MTVSQDKASQKLSQHVTFPYFPNAVVMLISIDFLSEWKTPDCHVWSSQPFMCRFGAVKQQLLLSLVDLQVHDILHQTAVVTFDERLKRFDPRSEQVVLICKTLFVLLLLLDISSC
jgi:hypothetical protein